MKKRNLLYFISFFALLTQITLECKSIAFANSLHHDFPERVSVLLRRQEWDYQSHAFANPIETASYPLTNPFFIENVGQFAEEARFQVRGSRRTIWLTDDAIWFVVWGKGRQGEGVLRSKGAEERRRFLFCTPAP
jgi:hypothetical protein